jgi:hypothetical protein
MHKNLAPAKGIWPIAHHYCLIIVVELTLSNCKNTHMVNRLSINPTAQPSAGGRPRSLLNGKRTICNTYK